MSAPYHLAKFDTKPENNFASEIIYRRCPFGNRQPPFNAIDVFLDIRWDDDLMVGLSVNRSRYSNPEDVLWSPQSENIENKSCTYLQKKGIVFASKANLYTATDLKTGVNFSLIHTPINCNISHSEIHIGNVPQQISKQTKREIKAFLASLFFEITIDNSSTTSIPPNGISM